jgi:hypothetical protein
MFFIGSVQGVYEVDLFVVIPEHRVIGLPPVKNDIG